MAFLSFPSPTQLKNLANPTDNQDAVTLAYLDTALNGSGNIVVANVSANLVTSNNVTANTVTVNGVINLGDVANVKIDGGTDGYVLSTDGTGNLSWVQQASGSGGTALPSVTVDSFVADGTTNSYQLTVTPASKDLVFINVDGVFQIRDSFDLFGNAISFGSVPLADSVIEVSTFVVGAAGGSGSNIDLTSVSGNIIPSANITYDLGSPTNRWRDIYLSGTTIDLAGATIKTDATTGAITLVPQPTVAEPNPTGIVITSSGTLTTVSTTNGTVNSSDIGNAVTNATSSTTLAGITSSGVVDLSPATSISLGEVANISIAGGNANAVLQTDGSGNLSWGTPASAMTYVKEYVWRGGLTENIGSLRHYIHTSSTLIGIYAYLVTAGLTQSTMVVKKNGTAINTITIPANSTNVNQAGLSISLAAADYLTVDITQSSSASDLYINFVYQGQ